MKRTLMAAVGAAILTILGFTLPGSPAQADNSDPHPVCAGYHYEYSPESNPGLFSDDGKSFTVPEPPSGYYWNQASVKAGSPQSGGGHDSVINEPRPGDVLTHSTGKDISHVDLCKVEGSYPPPTEPPPIVIIPDVIETWPTCESAGGATPVEHEGITWDVGNDEYGNITLTPTPKPGYTFPDPADYGYDHWTFIYPAGQFDQLTGEQCETPPPAPPNCDTSVIPGSVAGFLAEHGYDGGSCFDYTVNVECGVATGSVTNQPTPQYEVGPFRLVWNEGDGIANPYGPSNFPAVFPEDYNGGEVTISYYIVGPERDWFSTNSGGVPNYWNGIYETTVVDTDCIPPETTPELEFDCDTVTNNGGDGFVRFIEDGDPVAIAAGATISIPEGAEFVQAIGSNGSLGEPEWLDPEQCVEVPEGWYTSECANGEWTLTNNHETETIVVVFNSYPSLEVGPGASQVLPTDDGDVSIYLGATDAEATLTPLDCSTDETTTTQAPTTTTEAPVPDPVPDADVVCVSTGPDYVSWQLTNTGEVAIVSPVSLAPGESAILESEKAVEGSLSVDVTFADESTGTFSYTDEGCSFTPPPTTEPPATTAPPTTEAPTTTVSPSTSEAPTPTPRPTSPPPPAPGPDPQPPQPVPAGDLPATGTTSLALVGVAGASTLAGLGIWILGRRRLS